MSDYVSDEEDDKRMEEILADAKQLRIDEAVEHIMVYLREHMRGPMEASTAAISVIGNLYAADVPKEVFVQGIDLVCAAVDKVNTGDDSTGVIAISVADAKAKREERRKRGKA